ncbi:hypothetical protein [Inediibacterium massiliense]|uniref:hypothetical protein n=1 Tax=Inediibacterium massiliense TaxID=1658111 RepID=UPI0006B4732A|nr:hypothetical protein [Inediibacterium massiliense]
MIKNSPYQKMMEPSPYATANDAQLKKKSPNIKDLQPVCILADKVYSYCQQRDCFPKLKVEIGYKGEQFQFVGIYFQEGYICEGTLQVTPLGAKRPNFSRIQFHLKIPFTVQLRNILSGEIIDINGFLPDIIKDIVMYMPQARNEFNFKIVVETRSEVLAPVELFKDYITIPIGVLSVIRVVGKIELLVAAYSLNTEPPEAENYEECEKKMYREFEKRPFPYDFFPMEFEDKNIGV